MKNSDVVQDTLLAAYMSGVHDGKKQLAESIIKSINEIPTVLVGNDGSEYRRSIYDYREDIIELIKHLGV